jgi:hypothetical protein
MPELTREQKHALEQARHLADNGVPLFLARPDPEASTGFRLPKDWQHRQADPAVVDRWKPGMALCAVMGHLVDAVDIDPRNGGDRAALNGTMPQTYGQQATPSGGSHFLIASLGVRKGEVMPGIDLQAGDAEGNGRGFIFLAPTVRPSKVTGELAAYEWVEDPDVGMLLIGDDATGVPLAELARSRCTSTYDGPGYDGPSYEDLADTEREWADQHVDRILEGWRAKLAEAVGWDEGERDELGRGWEALSYQLAWALAMLVATPWTRLDEFEAAEIYERLLPEEFQVTDECADKWSDRLVEKAMRRPVEPPPWSGIFDDLDAGDAGPVREVDVTNSADALRWLRAEVGRNGLAGVFRRGWELVHTPRIGEDGYVPPANDRDSDGPAQVRRMSALELAARVDAAYVVHGVTRRRDVPKVFPADAAARAAATPDLLPRVKDLRSITHTPVVREDGTVLDQPGYDPASRMLYLPDPALEVRAVSEKPTRAEVTAAGKLLLAMVADFPFITAHDRANYLGALLTPLIRPMVPPPYKLVVIGAPQRGSGKSLLAWIMRELHGGVFKSEFPTTDDERRKVITSTLDATSAPVVQFDNVTGVLRSSVLDGLLTSVEWSDRLLGASTMLTLRNDRLWVVTGNNVHIGGDLERRTLWVTINANMERPETRHDFTIPNLEAWVREHRGELLRALLTLIRAWVVAGRPTGEAPTSDSFGHWIAALRGVLDNAGLGPAVGTVGHEDSVQQAADPEDEEWAVFLAAVRRAYGSEPWTAAELVGWKNGEVTGGKVVTTMNSELLDEDLPGDIAEKRWRSNSAAAKSLGKWLSFRNGRWVDGLSVQAVPASSKKHAKRWRVIEPGELGG